MPLSITRDDSRYPALLCSIHDPPRLLWCDGDVGLLSGKECVAVVGARECTPYGEQAAFEIARDLARSGVVVVSGLAYGIDTAAHRGALEAGGRTIAVLGCGIDVIALQGNRELQGQIAAEHLLISEYPPGTEAAPWNFPQRNRIVSGLSRGVVVVEAGTRSGSLITASLALDQGREVFAIPGNINAPLSVGTNRLIQSGAKLVASVADILEELGLSREGVTLAEKMEGSEANGTEERILALLAQGPRHMDELVETCGCPVATISSLLLDLEMGGKVRSLPGSRFARGGN